MLAAFQIMNDCNFMCNSSKKNKFKSNLKHKKQTVPGFPYFLNKFQVICTPGMENCNIVGFHVVVGSLEVTIVSVDCIFLLLHNTAGWRCVCNSTLNKICCKNVRI